MAYTGRPPAAAPLTSGDIPDGSITTADLIDDAVTPAKLSTGAPEWTSGYDFSLYEDTGTTAKLFWDASAESLGIGTTSPSTLLHLDAASDGRVARFGSGTSDTGGMYVTHNSGSTRSFELSADNILILDADRTNGRASSRLQFNVDGTERMRIDSSGNLLVGTTSVGGTAPSFAYKTDDGYIWVRSSATPVAYFDRNSSDGDIAVFRKDGTTVGSIGTFLNQITVGKGSTGMLFDGSTKIYPWNVATNSGADNQMDLGTASTRFKDLYLSGTANVSRGVGATETATLSANKTIDFATYQNFVYTLGASITLVNPTTEAVGQSGFIVFKQDATGSRTVSLGSEYLTAGGAGVTLSTSANSIDVVPYIVIASGQILLGTPQLAFA